MGRIVASVRGWPPAVHADLENWAESVPGAWVTPPLRRRRPPGGGRVLVLGDAAGYVEPLTGEGMTWAMESAELAADLIARGNVATWPPRVESLLRRRRRWCGHLTTSLRRRPVRWAGAHLLHRFPQLTRPLQHVVAGSATNA